MRQYESLDLDSITQIVLGAAVGEVVLGRKVGNRAMVWGGLAGTIPDLDIFGNLFLSEIDGLAFHRGISHSIFFAALFPWILGWLTDALYKSGLYKRKLYRVPVFVFGIAIFVLFTGVVNVIFYSIGQRVNLPFLLLTITVAVVFFIRLFRSYIREDQSDVKATYYDWVKLHFWAIFTHPLLDSCTTYGTQLFQPFWDYRVAFHNVSVADPAYTIPFLLCLVLASLFIRNRRLRSIFNWAGIGFSILYLSWSFVNKSKVRSVFERTLSKEKIEYSRYLTTPTILNNILWNCIAEGDTAYYQGFYSLLDKEPVVKDIVLIPKHRQNSRAFDGDRSLEILKWFSDDYYNVVKREEDGHWQYNDLRFGSLRNSGDLDPKQDFIFSFILKEGPEGLKVRENDELPENRAEMANDFFKRILGE